MPLELEQPSLPQDPEVVRDGRLGDVEEGDDLAYAELLAVLSQQVKDLHADRIGEGLADLREPRCPFAWQRPRGRRLTEALVARSAPLG